MLCDILVRDVLSKHCHNIINDVTDRSFMVTETIVWDFRSNPPERGGYTRLIPGRLTTIRLLLPVARRRSLESLFLLVFFFFFFFFFLIFYSLVCPSNRSRRSFDQWKKRRVKFAWTRGMSMYKNRAGMNDHADDRDRGSTLTEDERTFGPVTRDDRRDRWIIYLLFFFFPNFFLFLFV